MSVMRMWTICDRCSFKYRRSQMHKEANGLVVCQPCYDGKWDSVRHPQNRPFRPRRELLPVPDGRAQDQPPTILIGLEAGGFLLTEDGFPIEFTINTEYNIARSIYVRVR